MRGIELDVHSLLCLLPTLPAPYSPYSPYSPLPYLPSMRGIELGDEFHKAQLRLALKVAPPPNLTQLTQVGLVLVHGRVLAGLVMEQLTLRSRPGGVRVG